MRLSTRPFSISSMPCGAEDGGDLTSTYGSTSHLTPSNHQENPRRRKISFKNKIDFF